MVMRQDRTSLGDFSKPPWTWTEEDLNDLVASQRKEDWHVEYKSSDLLTDKNLSIKELTKAVSALSNGDGGRSLVSEEGWSGYWHYDLRLWLRWLSDSGNGEID